MSILGDIIKSKKAGKKLLSILIDPDKVKNVENLVNHLSKYRPDYLFVGGSSVTKLQFEKVISHLKEANLCPVIIFPGDHQQVSAKSDAILLLSLISGRNPEYLIGQHVKAAPTLKQYKGDIIPTSYILIDGGVVTSVQKVSETKPLEQSDLELICNTVIAGKLQGHQLHYLEAGSGAKNSVSELIISEATLVTDNPIIVGGGIKDTESAEKIWKAGADLIVIGNGYEDRSSLLAEVIQLKSDLNKAFSIDKKQL